jgi:hypothetical protein
MAEFEKDIAKSKVKSVDVLSVKNTDNDLFRLYYYFDAGKWNNKILPLAAEYLQYLGTKINLRKTSVKNFTNWLQVSM